MKLKSQTLQDYTGDFELNGSMARGPIERKTNIRFRKRDSFQNYINATDIDYESEDITFTGYVFKINKSLFSFVKRSAYAKGTNYMKDIVEN